MQLNGVNVRFYRPGNNEIELGIELRGRDGSVLAFYIFGGRVSKRIELWDVANKKSIWSL